MPQAASPEPQAVFAERLKKAASEEDRVSLLSTLADESWARSDMAVLRDSMMQEKVAVVRVKAYEVARAISAREGSAARKSVMRAGLQCPHGDVRIAALNECRADPDIELIPELLEAAQQPGGERFLAIHALSRLDDPRAQTCVLQAAKDEGGSRIERMRAVALLARSSLPEALEYLKLLAAADDKELSRVAVDALLAMQQARPR